MTTGNNTATYLNNRVKYQRPSAMLWSENQGTLATLNGNSVYVPVGYEIDSGAIITAASSSSPNVVYTANNYFSIGDFVTITGLSIGGFNGVFQITAANSSSFTVVNSTTGTLSGVNGLAQPAGNFIIPSDHNRGALDFKTNRLEKRQRMITGRMRSFWTADKLTLSTSWNNLPSRAFNRIPVFANENLNKFVPSTTDYQYTVDGGAGGVDLLEWYENHKGSFYVYLSYDKNTNFAETDPYSRFNHLKEYSQVLEMYISQFDYSVQKRGGNNFDLWNISLTLEEA